MKNLDRVDVFLKNKKPHDKRNKMDYNIFIFEHGMKYYLTKKLRSLKV